ncbi:MAG: hypothetical protein MJ252_04540 [archaeon]|nr:hypothetical protein [archaeon]
MIQNQRYKYIHQQNKVKVLSNEGNKSKYLDLVITKKKVENPKVYTTKYSIPLKNAPSPASYLRSSMPLSTKDTLSLKPNKKEYKNKITVTKEDKSLKESKDLRDNRKKYLDKNIKENKPIYNTRNKTKEEEKPLISDGNILKNSYDFNRMNRDKVEQSELRHSSCTRMNRGKETQLENLNINDDYLQKKLRDRNNARRNFLSPGVIHIPLKAEKLIKKENDKIKMIKEESEKVENPSNKESNENKNITVNTSNISNSISTKYYRKKDSNRNRKDKEFINKVNEKDKSKGKIKDIRNGKVIKKY